MEYTQLKCSKCKKYKRYNAFAKGPYANRGYTQYVCRSCTSKYDAANYARRAESVRANQLFYYYGITPERYEELYLLQDGKCAICKVNKDPWKGARGSKRGNVLSVDHDHTTNKVRGLLCNKCNFGIGQFKDSAKLLQSAFNYISSF